jgi:F-type H+-transporting ATPase subunit b
MTAAVPTAPSREDRACELRRKLAALVSVCLAVAWLAVAAAAQAPDAHAPAQPAAGAEHAAQDTHAAAAEGEHAAGEHGGLSGLIWPTINFVILAWLLHWFLRTPFVEYLNGRATQVRKDLVEAAELNRTATAQLAEVERRLQALPGEIDALKKRGVEEIAAEEERIASAAAADRARLLTQTRREIEVRLNAAQRELSEHAATLALRLAEQRLSQDMSAADHARLVDRYVQQVREQ